MAVLPTRVRAAAAVCASWLLVGCAGVGPGQTAGPPAEAPVYRVGDRWVYQAQDGFRAPITWTETHEVTAVGSGGITVKVTLKGPTVNEERTETWSAPGVVRIGAVYEAETSRFDPPLVRYQFPLQSGQSWNQNLRDLDKPPGPFGPIQRHVSVRGYQSVTTPAGTFDALLLRVIMRMDDETAFRWPTDCNYEVWYAPAVGASVREVKRADYLEKGGGYDSIRNPAQNAKLELISYTRGR